MPVWWVVFLEIIHHKKMLVACCHGEWGKIPYGERSSGMHVLP